MAAASSARGRTAAAKTRIPTAIATMSTTITATAVAVGGEEPGDRTPSSDARQPRRQRGDDAHEHDEREQQAADEAEPGARARAATAGPRRTPGRPAHAPAAPSGTARAAPVPARVRGPRRSRGRLLERVPDPVDRPDVAGRRRGGLELAAQVPDVAVDRSLVRLEARTRGRRRGAASASRRGRARAPASPAARTRWGSAARRDHRRSRGGGPGRARRSPTSMRSSVTGVASARLSTARTRATSSLGLNGLTT